MKFFLELVACLAIVQYTNALCPMASTMLTARGTNHSELAHAYAMAHTSADKPTTVPFNATEQLVSTTGEHAFVAPGPNDLRGPCPGLNAMANHGYIPHNGIATIPQFIEGTYEVFGMGEDVSLLLAVYGTVMDGDRIRSFSIGGTPPESPGIGSIVHQNGLTGSHNHYEGDVSPTRGDLYQYNDNHNVQLSQFQQLYDMDPSRSNYDIPLLTAFRVKRFRQSIDNNPYFCNAILSGVVVQPATYLFIFHLMANKSAEYPEGNLDGEVLKSFFSITGTNDELVYTPGHERIPDNWYKNAIGHEYELEPYIIELIDMARDHPEFVSIGCNNGTVNTFTPVDIENLTGGAYNAQTLLQGNNLACFALQSFVQSLPTSAVGELLGYVTKVHSVANSLHDRFACPQLVNIDQSILNRFPGWSGPGAGSVGSS